MVLSTSDLTLYFELHREATHYLSLCGMCGWQGPQVTQRNTPLPLLSFPLLTCAAGAAGPWEGAAREPEGVSVSHLCHRLTAWPGECPQVSGLHRWGGFASGFLVGQASPRSTHKGLTKSWNCPPAPLSSCLALSSDFVYFAHSCRRNRN